MAKRHRFLLGGAERSVSIERSETGAEARVDDLDPVAIEIVSAQLPGTVSLMVAGVPRRAYVARREGGFEVTVGARRFRVEPAGAGRRARGVVGAGEDPPGQISAPLAGVVVEVRVGVGDELEAGTTVVVLEAMKMQNEVHIPLSGTITAVHVTSRDSVDKGSLLVEYEPAEDPGE